MAKILSFLFLIILFYCGYIFTVRFDYPVVINYLDYEIKISAFTLGFLAIFLLITSIFITKIFIFLVNLPKFIKQSLFFDSPSKITDNLMFNLADSLAGKTNNNSFLEKHLPLLKAKYQDYGRILIISTTDNFDLKTDQLKALTKSAHFGYFAAKSLAITYFEKKFYEQALDYAMRVYNLNDTDSEVITIIALSNARLNDWEKFSIFMSKLNRIDPKIINSKAQKFADYYLLGAKYALEKGDLIQAVEYLENVMALCPNHYEALKLLLDLNPEPKSINRNLSLIKQQFASKPSLNLAVIYAKLSSKQPREVYYDLSKELDIDKHLETFLAISSYFDLDNDLKKLKHYNIHP